MNKVFQKAMKDIKRQSQLQKNNKDNDENLQLSSSQQQKLRKYGALKKIKKHPKQSHQVQIKKWKHDKAQPIYSQPIYSQSSKLKPQDNISIKNNSKQFVITLLEPIKYQTFLQLFKDYKAYIEIYTQKQIIFTKQYAYNAAQTILQIHKISYNIPTIQNKPLTEQIGEPKKKIFDRFT